MKKFTKEEKGIKMKKFTKEEKTLFKGDGGSEGLIQKHEVIHRPDLFKMSSSELHKWRNKVHNSSSWLMNDDDDNHPTNREWKRISHYIYYIKKEISIVDKDIIAIIKRKRNISSDIFLEGVSIVCNSCRKDSENELSIEYY